jgi:hypothetical protein
MLAVMNFHNHIISVLRNQGYAITLLEEADAISEYYSDTLPNMAFDYYTSVPESQ